MDEVSGEEVSHHVITGYIVISRNLSVLLTHTCLDFRHSLWWTKLVP